MRLLKLYRSCSDLSTRSTIGQWRQSIFICIWREAAKALNRRSGGAKRRSDEEVYQNLQRRRAVLPAIALLSCLLCFIVHVFSNYAAPGLRYRLAIRARHGPPLLAIPGSALAPEYVGMLQI